MCASICPDQRRMIEFILNHNIQALRQPKAEVIHQVRAVISPGQGNDLYCITLCVQIFHQLAVIQIPATDGVQRAVNYKPDFHIISDGRVGAEFSRPVSRPYLSTRYAAHADSCSHNTTFNPEMFAALIRSLNVVASIRAKCSMDGFSPANSGYSFNIFSL